MNQQERKVLAMSVAYNVLSTIAGRGLLLMGRIANTMGWTHEFNHCLGALQAGNTANCGPDCPLRAPVTVKTVKYEYMESSRGASNGH